MAEDVYLYDIFMSSQLPLGASMPIETLDHAVQLFARDGMVIAV